VGVFEGIANLLFLCMWRAGNGSRRAFFRKVLYVRIIKKIGNSTAVGAARKPIPHTSVFVLFLPTAKSEVFHFQKKKGYFSLSRTTSDYIQYDSVQGPKSHQIYSSRYEEEGRSDKFTCAHPPRIPTVPALHK